MMGYTVTLRLCVEAESAEDAAEQFAEFLHHVDRYVVTVEDDEQLSTVDVQVEA
jgi:hypothetical protein